MKGLAPMLQYSTAKKNENLLLRCLVVLASNDSYKSETNENNSLRTLKLLLKASQNYIHLKGFWRNETWAT